MYPKACFYQNIKIIFFYNGVNSILTNILLITTVGGNKCKKNNILQVLQVDRHYYILLLELIFASATMV